MLGHARRTFAITFLISVARTGLAAPADTAAAGAAADEAALAREARLEAVLRLALARNPDLLETRERVAARQAGADAAGWLPAPELKAELWGVPLASPLTFGRAQTIMLGLREAFPAFGARAAKRRMAAEEAGAAGDVTRARARDVVTQVRRAWADYNRASEEERIHREHVGLIGRLVELARAHYKSGQGSQQDVLRLSLQLARLHGDVADLEQQVRSARAQLNALMARSLDAPIVVAVPVAFATAAPAVPDRVMSDGASSGSAAVATATTPEVSVAVRAVRRGEAVVELARRNATWPSLMVGADYWYMPTFADPHAYGAMVSVGLPWLNPENGARVREAEHDLAAERRALEARRTAAALEVAEAAAKARAARRTLEILDTGVLPEAQRAFESAQAAYATGHGTGMEILDALVSYADVRLERVRARARLEISLADYDRAVGLSTPAVEEVAR